MYPKNFRMKAKLFMLIGLMTAVTAIVAGPGVIRLTGMSASLGDVDATGQGAYSIFTSGQLRAEIENIATSSLHAIDTLDRITAIAVVRTIS